MTQELYGNFLDLIEEKNQSRAPLFFTELMRLFCEEVNLELIYEKFIRLENRFCKFDLSSSEYEHLDQKQLKHADDLSIPHLVVCSNFKNDGEEEFSENLAQIFSAMEEMELSDRVIKKWF